MVSRLELTGPVQNERDSDAAFPGCGFLTSQRPMGGSIRCRSPVIADEHQQRAFRQTSRAQSLNNLAHAFIECEQRSGVIPARLVGDRSKLLLMLGLRMHRRMDGVVSQLQEGRLPLVSIDERHGLRSLRR